jgi:hypothetical protein
MGAWPIALLFVAGCCGGTDLSHCFNGVKDGDETDIDCGASCFGCPSGKACRRGADCQTLSCVDALRQPSSCTDGVKNGTETDVDCGGSCPGCPRGAQCLTDTDCGPLLNCIDGACVAPECKRGRTDCRVGTTCSAPTDCARAARSATAASPVPIARSTMTAWEGAATRGSARPAPARATIQAITARTADAPWTRDPVTRAWAMCAERGLVVATRPSTMAAEPIASARAPPPSAATAAVSLVESVAPTKLRTTRLAFTTAPSCVFRAPLTCRSSRPARLARVIDHAP